MKHFFAAAAMTIAVCAAPTRFSAAQKDGAGGTPTIRISAVITDASGRPIPKLSAQDLEVRDDGAVIALQTIGPRAGGIAPQEDDAAAADRERLADVGSSTRLFAILLDEFHVGAGAATDRVRDAVARFVREQLRDDDRAVVFKPLDSLGAIRFTKDRDTLMRAIATFSGRKGDYEPRSAFERNYVGHAPEAIEAARMQIVFSALRTMAMQLGEMRPATGAIVLVSEGFSSDDRTHAVDPRLPNLTAVVRSAIRFDVPIYAFDPEGEVRVRPAALVADDDDARAMLRRVAGETGGELVPDGADFSAGFERMARDLASRWVLTFKSPHVRDGKYHTLDIRVKRRDARILAPAGYWTPLPVEPRRTIAAPPPFASGRMLHRSPIIDAWVGVTRGADGTARMLVTWEPSIRSGDTGGVRTITLTATTVDGRVLFTGDVASRQPPGDEPATVPDRAAFDAPAGRVQLDMKIIGDDGRVLDNEARDVDVPDLRAPRKVLITTEIFRTRSAREFRALVADRDAAPAPGRAFSRTERLLIRVPCYDPGGADPRVTVSLLNRWGQTLRELAPMPGVAAPAQFDLSLAAFAPGEYMLQVTAAGASGETKEAITIRVTQ